MRTHFTFSDADACLRQGTSSRLRPEPIMAPQLRARSNATYALAPCEAPFLNSRQQVVQTMPPNSPHGSRWTGLGLACLLTLQAQWPGAHAQVAEIEKASNDSLLWGPYKPNLYFGVRPRIPKSLTGGLLWTRVEDYQNVQNSEYSSSSSSSSASNGSTNTQHNGNGRH